MRTRHLIVTDVHGNISALKKVLAAIGFSESTDVLVDLGDRIDRGKGTRECLEVFAQLKDGGRTPILLAGNHEAMLIEALQGDVSSLDRWLGAGFGSRATIASYKLDADRIDMAGTVLRVDQKPIRTAEDVEVFLLEVFGERLLELIRKSQRSLYLKDVYPGVGGFLCHGGLTFGLRISETSPRRLVWGDERWMRRRTDHPEPLIVIYGHFHGDRPVIRYKGMMGKSLWSGMMLWASQCALSLPATVSRIKAMLVQKSSVPTPSDHPSLYPIVP